ncbi:hypothetical protein [Streptomyces sp. RLB3-6]|uniref:hypothetical protein n=1 Tax=Streptomyces sp. RLB3-6 TaxID=2594457 RepID=UPI0013DEF5D6|nr:hypothetical protein [Streptomyces sp. RLB3-6]
MNNPSLASADATAGELEAILSAAQEAASALRDSAGLDSWAQRSEDFHSVNGLLRRR